MVECGAYWGFYSLWFARDVPGGIAGLIEPNAANLETGRRNFRGTDLRAAAFIESAVGQASAEGKPSAVSIDDFLRHMESGNCRFCTLTYKARKWRCCEARENPSNQAGSTISFCPRTETCCTKIV